MQAIEEALSSGLPLFRSFDPREVLARSLAVLAEQGADLANGSATLNFDSLEVTIPADSVDAIKALPWVSQVGSPLVASPSGQFDSEGLQQIGSQAANLAGLTGAGITVAIIDDGFNFLNKTISSCFDDDGHPGTPCIPVTELPSIPVSKQYRVLRPGTSTDNISLDGTATQTIDGEHGAACAEVV